MEDVSSVCHLLITLMLENISLSFPTGTWRNRGQQLRLVSLWDQRMFDADCQRRFIPFRLFLSVSQVARFVKVVELQPASTLQSPSSTYKPVVGAHTETVRSGELRRGPPFFQEEDGRGRSSPGRPCVRWQDGPKLQSRS